MMPDEYTTPDLAKALRRSMEAFNRRDLDAALTIYTPNAVWDWSLVGLAFMRDLWRYVVCLKIGGILTRTSSR
jgi:hypothetical protein